MPEELPFALAVRPWDEGGIEVGETYSIVSKSNSEWMYVINKNDRIVGWVPSYCFDDTFCECHTVTKKCNPSTHDFIFLEENDIFSIRVYYVTYNFTLFRK